MLLPNKLAYANVWLIMKSDSQIIDELGGNQKVAEICHPTLPEVVSGWRSRGIPRAWKAFLKVHSPHLFGSTINDGCKEKST